MIIIDDSTKSIWLIKNNLTYQKIIIKHCKWGIKWAFLDNTSLDSLAIFVAIFAAVFLLSHVISKLLEKFAPSWKILLATRPKFLWGTTWFRCSASHRNSPFEFRNVKRMYQFHSHPYFYFANSNICTIFMYYLCTTCIWKANRFSFFLLLQKQTTL